MFENAKINVKNKPIEDRFNVFRDRKGRLHQFTPAGACNASVCCQKCSLASTAECSFAPCRYYERPDKQNGFFQQFVMPKR